MANDKTTASMPFTAGLEWLKPVVDGQAVTCRELLDFSAGRLREQADFVQSLADCRSLPEVAQHQSQFVQNAWAAYVGEAMKMFGRMGEVAGRQTR